MYICMTMGRRRVLSHHLAILWHVSNSPTASVYTAVKYNPPVIEPELASAASLKWDLQNTRTWALGHCLQLKSAVGSKGLLASSSGLCSESGLPLKGAAEAKVHIFHITCIDTSTCLCMMNLLRIQISVPKDGTIARPLHSQSTAVLEWRSREQTAMA